MMLPAAAGTMVAAVPLFALLIAEPTRPVMLVVEFVLGLLAAAFYAPVPALITELFPVGSRTTGVSIAYNIAVTVFGGPAPFALTWLIAATGSNLVPGIYLAAAALVSLAGTVFLGRRFRSA